MVGEVIQYHNRITPKPGEWVKLAVLDFSIKPGGGCVPHLRQSLKVRDRPLEKLWGGGAEFSSRRNFFSLSNSLYEFFLGHCMNIF